MTAFFNNITENAMDGNRRDTPPIIYVMNEEQKKEDQKLKEQIAELKKVVPYNQKDPEFLKWAEKAKTEKPEPAPKSSLNFDFTQETFKPNGKAVFVIDKNKKALVLDNKTVLDIEEQPNIEFNKTLLIWIVGLW